MSKFIKWLLLLPVAVIIQPLIIWVFIVVPILLYQLIETWNIFFFFLIGGILLGLYYTAVSFSSLLYQSVISKYRPDYWVTSIVLCISAIVFVTSYLFKISYLFTYYKAQFMTINGIIFLICIIPAYLSIAYYFVILPFVKKDILKI